MNAVGIDVSKGKSMIAVISSARNEAAGCYVAGIPCRSVFAGRRRNPRTSADR